MNAFKVDLQALVSRHVAAAKPEGLLKLVEALSSGSPEVASSVGYPASRFINLDAEGNVTTGDHVVVRDTKTGLEWLAEPVQSGKEFCRDDAMKAAAAVDCMGFNDWRAPTIEEQLSVIDYTKYDPAVDTRYFKGPYSWTWTATLAAAPLGFAWGVALGSGDSFRFPQANHGVVRAVRAGQQLGLLV